MAPMPPPGQSSAPGGSSPSWPPTPLPTSRSHTLRYAPSTCDHSNRTSWTVSRANFSLRRQVFRPPLAGNTRLSNTSCVQQRTVFACPFRSMGDIFVQHPVHDWYCANVRGQIYNTVTSRELKGSVMTCGYVILTIQTDEGQKTIKKHRLVVECLLGRQLSPKEHVHHKSEDKLDNSWDNLAVLTLAEHAKHHSKREHPPRWFVKPVVRLSENGDRAFFASCTEAAKACGLFNSNLSTAIKTGRRFGGFRWEYGKGLAFPDLEDEEWKPVQGTRKTTDMQVSSKGRIKGSKGVTHGHKRADGYFTAAIGGKNYLVHRLVCCAFHGPAPDKRTVDHIDRNPGNNCADNLRWATRSEQIHNRC